MRERESQSPKSYDSRDRNKQRDGCNDSLNKNKNMLMKT